MLNDNTVRLGGTVIDVPPGPHKRSYARSRVEVCQLLDGSWSVYLDDAVIATQAATTTAELRTIKRRRRRPPSAAWKAGVHANERTDDAARVAQRTGDPLAEHGVNLSSLPSARAFV